MKKFALLGNPNSGKTTLFNSLTGSTAHVGNWPGVTVDKKEGTYKKLQEEIAIIDLPGIYSLSPYTPEEIISRNYILEEKPDCVINIVDVTNIERNLYLTTQIMEINVPVVIALNMMDTLRKNGKEIDAKRLEDEIGVPVIEISALKQENLDELMFRAYAASLKPRKGTSLLVNSKLQHLVRDVEIAFKGLRVDNSLFHAVKIIEKDEIEEHDHPELINIVDEFKNTFSDDTFGNDLEAIVADARYNYITSKFSGVVYKVNNQEEDIHALTLSDKIDRVLTNRWLGIPIFLIMLFLVFHLTFSENLFYLGGLFENIAPSFEGTIFEGVLWHEGGLNSPGAMLFYLMDALTSSLGDFISLLSGAPLWIQSFVSDGALAGVFGVLSFVPQILLLFLLFSILEDSGYMARVVFILDRIFRKFGLSGRAFIPMIMGFGCSVPAIINTRTLGDEKEKIATVRVIPFFSCGAKLPILTAIAGAIVAISTDITNPDVITYLMYIIGMLTAIVTILIMRHTTMKGDTPPFIMELPTYHLPQFKSLMIHLWDKLKHYIEKAFTIILASTIVIWFLSSFNWGYEFLPEIIIDGEEEIVANLRMNESILAGIGSLIAPLFAPLGFGSNLSNFAWVFAVAAVTGLIAKENVIGTFGTLAACVAGGLVASEDGIAEVAAMISATGITIPALISFIAFNMTTIPCFAAVATTKGELTKKQFRGTLLFWLVTSYIVSMMINLIGTYWWTAFIFILIAIIGIFGIKFYNKYVIK